MSRLEMRIGGVSPGFPRVSGDEPHTSGGHPGAPLFSPRERG